jgi:ATP-dependent exoDNAse (exonuclease V) alpha subunit
MCCSGARLQLAIAPAGAGKTTAMRTLVRAWRDSGGHVVGLAPSAAAAAQLRDATGAPAETLAKLTWSIHHDDLPEWAERIGRSSLVIIDEAGMADTLSLDTAVQFIIGRGGSIRLIGDDQQLAAIGAGGVLTSDSQPRTPLQIGNGGSYSPPKPPAPPRTRSCPNSRKG